MFLSVDAESNRKPCIICTNQAKTFVDSHKVMMMQEKFNKTLHDFAGNAYLYNRGFFRNDGKGGNTL